MDLDGIIDWANKNIKAEYVEIRGEELSKLNIELKDGTFSTFTSLKSSGFGIRVLAEGAWGFSSTTKIEELKNAIEKAYKMAKAASRGRYEKINLADIDIIEDEVKSKMRIKPEEVDVQEKVKRMKDLERELKNDKNVKSTRIIYQDTSGTKVLYTSEGTKIVWDMGYVWQYIWATGKNEKGMAAARDEIGSVDMGWELFQEESVEKVSKRVLKKLNAQLNGVSPKRGEYPIVAGPIIVGIIAHEALGHLAEADLTINSPFRDLIGKQIAPEFVNMSDRIVENGFGNNVYDDEGTKIKDVHIIKDGILTEIMLNREYAARWGMEPNGHARAENYTVPPIIRMRNTVFERGDHSFEELLEGIKFGYYLVDFRGGQAELNSSFQVGVQEGYIIRNGELAESIKDTSISGIAIDALKKISAVGKDFGLEMGRCGKGQTAFVSSGGPHMRFDKGIVVGGQQ
ncbi:TldD/PmbA family protein [Candidatus Aciduliprofundum boonei]|uniref:Peptidase U62 modulator of DNA gyrase n=1 Tax=Aciduliprofundum boonei (strain DSM 19572 / T469) TaxID=439481 RepID=B5I9J6_ACIB4|nr:TldD/PmbA family protein [Candidatus Aciduliprofundum boonei]ADD08533.1 peptidase U62 modulator of DNA gyrase [Aciduliprofundum boonei T469]EDY36682.1 TldD/PmbA family [Aciduliprofundum boonei T469]HII54612.1 TldD/PmbA family protein [Candidatus Aciduliprofundum boonei]